MIYYKSKSSMTSFLKRTDKMTTQPTRIKTKDVIYELAKAVIDKKKGVSYGRIRSKLTKQGFSEIALYSAAARHCEENFIPPSKYTKDMIILLEGCGRDILLPKTHNDYHYLRGQYHDIRHGDLSRDEAKSPEQRGLFLCNTCFLVLDGKLRSKNKNEQHTCGTCKQAKSKEKNQERASRSKVDNLPEIDLVPESECSKSVLVPAQETNNMTEANKQIETRTFANVVNNQTIKSEDRIKVSEVIADENGATVTINCSTSSLHIVLASVAEITHN